MKDNLIKAKFCRKHFTSILTFINHCDINNNDFGMGFLLEFISEDDERKFSWQFEEADRNNEKDLMLGFEEFWAITEEKQRNQRNQIIEILTNDTITFQNIISIKPFMDEILTHFGCIRLQELSEVCPSAGQFTKFLTLLTDIDLPTHLNDEDKSRKIQLISIFAVISLTALLRKEWNKPDSTLHFKYKTPPAFEMPEQRIYVNITIKKPIRYPNDEHSNLQDNQERHMSFYMKVRKYKPFKVDMSYGKKNFLLKRIEVEQTLTYYYWNTQLNITIPSEYETQPIIVHLIEDKTENPILNENNENQMKPT